MVFREPAVGSRNIYANCGGRGYIEEYFGKVYMSFKWRCLLWSDISDVDHATYSSLSTLVVPRSLVFLLFVF